MELTPLGPPTLLAPLLGSNGEARRRFAAGAEQVRKYGERFRQGATRAGVRHHGNGQIVDDTTKRSCFYRDTPDHVTGLRRVTLLDDRVVFDPVEPFCGSVSAGQNLHEIEVERRDNDCHAIDTSGTTAKSESGCRGSCVGMNGPERTQNTLPSSVVRLDRQERSVDRDRGNRHPPHVMFERGDPIVARGALQLSVCHGGSQRRFCVGGETPEEDTPRVHETRIGAFGRHTR
jgi:hypothetical protein